MPFNLQDISTKQTLFLDRDGVINHERDQNYVNTWEEFTFYDGVLQAMKIFAAQFKYIFIVTNQRGVGKGVTTKQNLSLIHQNMTHEINAAGGRIDGIYFCPDLNNDSRNRKPQTGMAFKAKADFPLVDFSQSVMVGNNFSDMEFGRNIGAATIFLATTHPGVNAADQRIDAVFNSLVDFAQTLHGFS